jgi:curved DNA-binding protein CbpA
MAAADHGGPGPDLYQLLGVPREASREEIAVAWRRRARAEHPDARPADADAPGRFRALAGAWQVLGDPARRAAYDRALARERQPAVRVAEPPLRAGPVRVERPRPAPPAADWDEDIGLAVLAELTLRYLARDRARPW